MLTAVLNAVFRPKKRPRLFEPALLTGALEVLVRTMLFWPAVVFVRMLKLPVAPEARAAMDAKVNVGVAETEEAVERMVPWPLLKVSAPMPWVLFPASSTLKTLVPVKVRAVPVVPLRLPFEPSPICSVPEPTMVVPV